MKNRIRNHWGRIAEVSGKRFSGNGHCVKHDNSLCLWKVRNSVSMVAEDE